ncbi:sugar phosphate isomerase/epimerase [Clostridiales bacterium COT073_COT-073]|nr:sugar phosphate isomerase/epimerase [Clostridiales bacterium COT073_COT-073]
MFKYGFMSNVMVANGKKELDKIMKWAKEKGFNGVEVGPTIPLNKDLFQKTQAEYGVKVAALTYCRNFLSHNEKEAEEHKKALTERIHFASELSIPVIVTSTGIDKRIEEVYDRADAIRKIPRRSLEQVIEVFKPIIELAESKGVKIAFENCPLMGNIAISPIIWRELFEKLNSQNVGLCYDPSHLVWQMIDPYRPIAEFGDKIFHFHAKDTQVDQERLSEVGILTDFSWWRACIPGEGSLDWRRILDELQKIDYQGFISVEHEDTNYEGSIDKVEQGIWLAKEYLKGV